MSQRSTKQSNRETSSDNSEQLEANASSVQPPAFLHVDIQWTGSRITHLYSSSHRSIIKAEAIGQIKSGKIELHDQVSLVFEKSTIPCRVNKIIILSAEKNFDGVFEARQGQEVFLALEIPVRYKAVFKNADQISRNN